MSQRAIAALGSFEYEVIAALCQTVQVSQRDSRYSAGGQDWTRQYRMSCCVPG